MEFNLKTLFGIRSETVHQRGVSLECLFEDETGLYDQCFY